MNQQSAVEWADYLLLTKEMMLSAMAADSSLSVSYRELGEKAVKQHADKMKKLIDRMEVGGVNEDELVGVISALQADIERLMGINGPALCFLTITIVALVSVVELTAGGKS